MIWWGRRKETSRYREWRIGSAELRLPLAFGKLLRARKVKSRLDPFFSQSCSEFLSKLEWTALVTKSSRNLSPPRTPPSIADMIIEIAKLKGYLARKKDGPPGTLVLWRGWKRLMDITEGWAMALKTCDTCG